MALTLYERQKRWRERNRELFNLRRRNARNGKVDEVKPLPPSLPPKISELRALIEREHERVVEEPVKPQIFRNDYGQIISERVWKQLQEKKEAAKKGGYILDDYSQ